MKEKEKIIVISIILVIFLSLGFYFIKNIFDKTHFNKDLNEDFLILFVDSTDDKCGYKNLQGDVIIPLGKYNMCFTDTFKSYAIVTSLDHGMIAIDRKENTLYRVFPFDNGPDYPSEGLFRIIINNKIGYADYNTGEIVIKPQFDCAWPFEKGVAKVSNDCVTKSEGEHSTWISDKWFYIDKIGTEQNFELQNCLNKTKKEDPLGLFNKNSDEETKRQECIKKYSTDPKNPLGI